jgi:hypothetical protein
MAFLAVLRSTRRPASTTKRIEPVAEVWGSLDTSIDGRWENPVTVKSQFTGFHRIEQMLWQDNSLNGAAAMCSGLVKNEQQLLTLVSKAQYNPLEMASGATDLINEAGTSKISGEEERYSNTDLPVFAANVEASMKAAPTDSPPSPPTRTSGWPATSTTAGPGSCAAVTPSPTESTRRPARSSAACSSSPSCRTRPSSSSSSGRWRATP